MRFHVHTPPPPLSEYIGWLWYFDGLETDHHKEKILPDGSIELLINLDETPRKLFDKKAPSHWRSFREAWLSGPQTEFLLIDSLPKSSMMGVHIKPGGTVLFLGMPATEVAGAVVELEAIWGKQGLELRESLLGTPGPAAKLRRLEAFLLGRMRKRFVRHPAVTHALEQFTRAPHESTVGRTADRVGLSRRRFIEVFRHEVGMTPKRFCRLQRFQRVLREIESRRSIDWADLSAACGYYDQSHFIHEFQAFSGINPAAYLVQKGEYLNFIPIREKQ